MTILAIPAASVAIGVHVHAEPLRLRATLAALAAHTSADFDLLLLPDGPDIPTRAALARMQHLRQSANDMPLGAAACFNRLARETSAARLVLLESGTIVSPGWLEKLMAALDADEMNGLACPSTNRSWNQLAAFPNANAADADIARTASEAALRFGESWQSLAPLWDIGDFCLAAKRSVIDTVGLADEAYGQGPCWEMDYAVSAVRAGYLAVWAQGAYVYRYPFTPRRKLEEERRFESSRRRYQDKFCGLMLSGARKSYVQHCQGEHCPHFAPAASIAAASVTVSTHAADTIPVPTSADNAACVPLVSCIMPTSGRPDWLPQAIRYFQRQDYANLELIIIDASRDDLSSRLPDDPRIHHQRIQPGSSIGAMRNAACELAQGEIIIHWDDDDWYSTHRVTAQVRPILEGRADITALNDTLFFDLESWRFWRCTPQLYRRLFVLEVHGGTLAFRRSLFNSYCRYPELSLAEDAHFLQRVVSQGARLLRLPGDGLFTYLRHGRNAWALKCGSHLDPRGWHQSVEPDEIAIDREFYASRSPAAPRAIVWKTPQTLLAVKVSADATVPASQYSPSVSCIMPTANRRPFVRGAIDRFLAQNYPASELIILDDGDDSISDLVPSHPALRYVNAQRYRSLGAKRNAACELAGGDIILHWDDDDWYAPHRIRIQVNALVSSGAEICGLDRVLFYDPRRPAAWEYVYPAGGMPWVFGATLCYLRDYWRSHAFPDMTIGEDNSFVAAASSGRICVIPDNRFFVGLVHPTNTSPKQVRDPRWRPRAVGDVQDLVGSDWPPEQSRWASRRLNRGVGT